ncbi:hypothetical protein TJA_25070 [Thermus sp. LT1-2-5]|uniref:hypothetical protein n=1 Tax=Thermus sp. LT1-2-5 TaxID=3026935 RepID=UPI0030E80C30
MKRVAVVGGGYVSSREFGGSLSSIVFLSLPQDDPRQRRPDITLAKRLLGWEPRTPVREGLRLTIAYFRGVVGHS